MGLDLYIGEEDDKETFSLTYNLSKMWYELFPEDEEVCPIDGLKGKEALPRVVKAYNLAIEKEAVLRRLEPDNGWGSYYGFVTFLHTVIVACLDYPNHVWNSWR